MMDVHELFGHYMRTRHKLGCAVERHGLAGPVVVFGDEAELITDLVKTAEQLVTELTTRTDGYNQPEET